MHTQAKTRRQRRHDGSSSTPMILAVHAINAASFAPCEASHHRQPDGERAPADEAVAWRGKSRWRGPPFDAVAAVRIARGKNPGLADGEGSSATAPWRRVPLIRASGDWRRSWKQRWRPQFEKFAATALSARSRERTSPSHSPVVWILMRMRRWHITLARRTRVTCEPFWLNTRWRGDAGFMGQPAAIYRLLSLKPGPPAGEESSTPRRVALQNAGVDEAYLARLLPALPTGDSELYSHPSLDQYPNGIRALVSPRVKARSRLDIKLIRYQDCNMAKLIYSIDWLIFEAVGWSAEPRLKADRPSNR